MILNGENQVESLQESPDSMVQKLIYQIAFKDADQISWVLENMEDKCSERTYIEVNISTFEEAYINIEKKEDDYIENLIDQEDLERFM